MISAFLNAFLSLSRPQKAIPEHLRAGIWGEDQAARYLKKRGYRILEKRFRAGRRGEIDIVCRKDDTLVFVEVKTRRSETFGRPASAVTAAKKTRISRTAWQYLKRMKKKPPLFRFDIIEVIGQEGQGPPSIRHIENAFSMTGGSRVPW